MVNILAIISFLMSVSHHSNGFYLVPILSFKMFQKQKYVENTNLLQEVVLTVQLTKSSNHGRTSGHALF